MTTKYDAKFLAIKNRMSVTLQIKKDCNSNLLFFLQRSQIYNWDTAKFDPSLFKSLRIYKYKLFIALWNSISPFTNIFRIRSKNTTNSRTRYWLSINCGGSYQIGWDFTFFFCITKTEFEYNTVYGSLLHFWKLNWAHKTFAHSY